MRSTWSHPVADRFYATTHHPLHAWQIVDRLTDAVVDVVRSPRVAAYEIDLLNTGQAHVDDHGVLGCRVVLNAVAVAA